MPAPIPSLVDQMAAAWSVGNAARVVALARKATGADREGEGCLALLGMAEQARGRYRDAAQTFARLTRMRPQVSAYWNNLGVVQRALGNAPASADALAKALALAPDDAEVHFNLGLLYLQQRRWREARQALIEAVRLSPQFVEARLEAAHACHVCGDSDGEAAMLDGAEDWPPQPAAQALTLATMLSLQGRLEAALRALTQACVPAGAGAAAMRVRIAAARVVLYERSNRLVQARQALQQLPVERLEALPRDASEARIDGWRAHALVAMRDGAYADAAAWYQRVLASGAEAEARVAAGFGLAYALDRQARPLAAWSALQAAHALQLETVRGVAPELLEPGARSLPLAGRRVEAHAYAAWSPRSAPDAPHSPVFVIGFPRSGTTLLEQMLDAHPDFQSMGERGFVYDLIARMEQAGQRYPADLAALAQTDVDHLRAVYFKRVATVLPERGQRRLVDKNPLNMLCLPMLQRLFPEARILLCLRHPCDVLLSCSMQSFRSPAFMVLGSSLPRLARGYAEVFDQCCAHLDLFAPHVLTWRYESVVSNFAAQVARLAPFLDIADAAPLAGFAQHARGQRFIATPSYAQVIQPLSRTAVGRWEAYREYFAPVLPILWPWLERFGYAA